MDSQSKPKNILLVDDDQSIRLVLKKLIFKHFPSKDLGLNIYSSSKGVEGLGLIFSIESDVIIIDTTLPKYNNLEIIEYLLTNQRIKSLNPKIIVLYYKEKLKGFDNYTQIDKSNIFFYKKVLNEIKMKIVPDFKRKFILGEWLMRLIGVLIVNFSEQSTFIDRDIITDRDRSIFIRGFHFASWCINQFFLNFLLLLFYVLDGNGDPDTNIQQRKEDVKKLHKRFYTTYTTTLLAVIFIGLTGFQTVSAATKTWDGGGTDNLWSTCANWNLDTCPAPADSVIFDSTSSKAVTIDSLFAGTIASISINTGYAGIITQARTLTVTSFSQAAGTFNGATQSIGLTTFSLTGGAFTSTSGTLSSQGNFTISGSPTFNANGGTISFIGSTTTVAISCNSATFNLVTFSRNPGASSTTLNNCTFPLGNNPTAGINGSSTATFTLNSSVLSGTGTLTVNTSAVLVLNSGSSLSGFSGLSTRGFTINGVTANLSGLSALDLRAGDLTISSAGNLSLPAISTSINTLTVSGASTFTTTSLILSVGGDLNISSDSTFNHNSGTINFNGIVSQAIACNSKTFNLVTFNRAGASGATLTSCTFPLGNNPSLVINSSSVFTLALNSSTLTGTGTFTISSNASLTLNTGGSISGFSGLSTFGMSLAASVTADFSSYSSFTLRGGNLTLASSSVLTVPNVTTIPIGTFSMTAATFNSTSGILSATGDFTITGASTYNANGGTLNFTSFNSQIISCNSATFTLVTFTKNGTPGVTLNSCTFPLGNNPTVAINDSSIGSMTMNSSTLSGTGTMTVTTNDVITMNASSTITGFSNLSVRGLTIAGATANFSSFTSMSISDTITLSSGSLTMPPTASTVLLTISGGTFTAPSGNMTVSGTLSISGAPTFNNNSGTFVFSGSTATLTCNSVTFNAVSFAGQTGVKTIDSGCNLPVGASPTIPNGITLSGTISGSGTLTFSAGTQTINTTGVLSGFTGAAFITLTVAGPTLNLSTYSPLTIIGVTTLSSGTLTMPAGFSFTSSYTMSAGTFSTVTGNLSFNALTVNAGTFNAPTGTLTAANTFNLAGGSFVHNNGTVNFTGASQPITCTGAVFNLVSFVSATGNPTINSGCSLPLGANPTMGSGFTLSGTLSGTGTLTTNNNATLTTGAALTGFTGLIGVNLALNNTASLDLGSYNPVTFSGTFSQSNTSVFTAPSGTMTFGGSFTITAGTFNHNNGTLVLTGLGNLTCANKTFNFISFAGQTGLRTIAADCFSFPVGANPVFPNSITMGGRMTGSGTITNTTGTFTIQSPATLTGFSGFVGNNLTISSISINMGTFSPLTVAGDFTMTGTQTFTAPSGTMSIGGNFVHTAGTFTHNSGTVVFNGNTQTVSGIATTFNNLSKTLVSAAPQTLTFPSTITQTVAGALTLNGFDTTNRLLLRASSNGSRWSIDPQGTRNVLYLDVKDSNNISVTPVEVGGTGSLDSINNINWNFNSIAPNAPTSLGSASVVNGTLIANTTPSFSFTLSDPNTLDTVKYNFQLSLVSDFSSLVIDYTNALGSQGGKSFQVGQSAGTGTYTMGNAAQVLSSGNYYWRVRATDNNGLNSSYTTANSGAIAFVLDALPPNAFTPVLSPPSPTNDTTPDVSFSTTDNVAIDHYEVKIDLSSFTTRSSPYTLPTQPNGSHTVTIRAYDTAGNHTDGSVTFTIDTSSPVAFTPLLNVTSPTQNQTPTLTFSTTDPDGIGHYEVKIDSGIYTTQTSPYVLPTLDENVHSINVRAFDIAGNFTNGTLLNLTIDLTPPNDFSPSTLSGNTYTNDQTPDIYFDTADYNGIASYAVKIDGGGFSTQSSSYTTPTLSEGDHLILVRAFDNAGNFTDGSFVITIDLTPPSVFTPSVSPTSPGTDSTPTITFSTTDDQVMNHYEIKVDGGSFTTQVSPYTLPTVSEGGHTITVRAFDTAGNTRDGSVNYTLDTGVPNAFAVNFNVSSPTNNQTPQTTFSTTDSDGINRYELKIDSGSFSVQTSPYTLPTLATGLRTITVRAYDNAGNFTDSIGTILIDITSPNAFTPGLNVISPSNNISPRLSFTTIDTNGINHYEVKVDSGSFSTQSTNYFLPTLSEGAHTITVRAFDNAGNTRDGTANLYTDLTLPIINYNAPTLVSDVSITDTTITVTDDHSISSSNVSTNLGTFDCTQNTPTSVSCTTAISSSGNLRIDAQDSAGNSANTTINGYVIDTIAPDITITAPTKNSVTNITDTTILITDNSGIDRSDVNATGGSLNCIQTNATNVDCTSTIFVSGNLSVTATDIAGNSFNKVESGYVIASSDPAPFTPILNTGLYTNNTSPQVSFVTTDDDGINRYEVKVDSGAFAVHVSPYTLPTLSDGFHTITVRAYDTLGYFIDGSVNVNIDTINPATFTPTIDEGAITTETRPTVRFSTTDASGLDHFEVNVDGGVYIIQSSPHRLQILSDGAHTIAVRAVDRAGNFTIGTVNVTVDTTSPDVFTPILNVTSPTNSLTPEVSFITTDNTAVTSYQVKVDAGSFSTQTSPYTLPTQIEGLHTITVRAMDGAGNFRDGSVDVFIDITAPAAFTIVFNVTSPTNNPTPQVTFTTTDSETGINHYEIKADNTSFVTGASVYTMPSLTSGSRTITVRAFDNAGNFTDSSAGLVIDLTSPNAFTPILDVTSPTNNPTPTLTFSTTDNIAISYYQVQVDSSSYTTQTSPYILPSLLEGVHSINVAAYDTAGNSRVENVGVTIDLTGPSITFIAPTSEASLPIADTTIVVNDNYKINAADVHATGGIISCDQTTVSRVDCTVEVNVSGDLSVNVTDVAGNTASAAENGYVIHVASTPPNAFTPILDTGAITTIKTPTVSFITTAVDGIDHYDLKVDDGIFTTQISPYLLPELTDGFHSIVVRAFSSTGNTTDGAANVTIDSTLPSELVLNLNITSPTKDNRPLSRFSAQDPVGIEHYEIKVESSGGVFTTQTSPYQTEALADGGHTITLKAFDNAGNTAEIAQNFVVDTSKPTGTITINDDAAETTVKLVTIKLTAIDNLSVASMILSEKSDFSDASPEPFASSKDWLLSDGGEDKTVYVKFFDSAGNESQVYSDSIKYVAPPSTENVSESIPPSNSNPTDNAIVAISNFISRIRNSDLAKTISNSLPAIALVSSALVGVASAVTYPSVFAYGFFFIRTRRKYKKFGIVYDIDSKAPVPFALVRIYDNETNKLISESPTDLDGKYGFVIDAGKYKLRVASPDYAKYEEEIYFENKEGNFGKNIPLSKLVNTGGIISQIKKRLNTINRILVYAGFTISIIALVLRPSVINVVIVLIYLVQAVILFILGRKVTREWGYVFKSLDERVKGAFVRVYDSNVTQLEAAMTDDKGRYKFNLKDGEYLISADAPGLTLSLEGIPEDRIYKTPAGNLLIKATVVNGKPVDLTLKLV